MTVCATPNCTNELPARDGSGRPRKWCSTRCMGTRKQAWAREHDRGLCPCGAKTGIGSVRRGYKHCDACAREMRTIAVAMRRERIYEMWHAGLRLIEIAERLGITENYVGVEIAKMRATGWDVPYRYRGYER